MRPGAHKRDRPMTTTTTIRPTRHGDLAALATIAEETELFPGEMLPDMAAGFLNGDADSLWLTGTASGDAAGFCYCVPETLADGVWTMLALGVAPGFQRGGLGADLVAAAEAMLRERGQRLLIVETSSAPGFAAARAFYDAQGYTNEARIRDFWAAGDDKIVFRKAL